MAGRRARPVRVSEDMNMQQHGFPLASTARPYLILALSLLLGSCSLPLLQPPPEQATRSYVLDWDGGGLPPARAPRRESLLISPVLSAPGFDSSDMVYIRTPHQIEYFANHRWVDSPAQMLGPLLVQAAEQTGLFRNVVETGSGSDVELRLDTRLIHLQQVCRLNPSQLQLALRVTLTEVASARVIASRTLTVSESIQARNPYAGVQAANRAVAQLLSELQTFLDEQVR